MAFKGVSSGKFVNRQHIEILFFLFFPENMISHFMQIVSIFSFFLQKTGFYISCKLSQFSYFFSWKQDLTFHANVKSCVWGKNTKNTTSLSFAELAQSVVTVKTRMHICFILHFDDCLKLFLFVYIISFEKNVADPISEIDYEGRSEFLHDLRITLSRLHSLLFSVLATKK